MDLFDQVMKMEKDGEALYRELAKRAPAFGMAKIFDWLADQEQKHYETFLKMKEGKSVAVAGDEVLRNIKDIFEGWKKNTPQVDPSASQANLYRQALETEQRSVALYEEQSKMASKPEQKEIWLKIAAEEKNHERVLENIIEFVTKPDFWVENAEFSHLEANYYL
ncbi:MAG TPA: ferritin family protein [Candidatus Omnitrophota bacterium]|nr:ferritin family protein [Candidatus Omnitrophota bacterium]